MLENEERVDRVLQRTWQIRQGRERKTQRLLTVSAVLLSACLVVTIGTFADFGSTVAVNGLYGASSLLGSEVGGYILVALISFVLAVVVTLLYVRRTSSPLSGFADSYEKEERHD